MEFLYLEVKEVIKFIGKNLMMYLFKVKYINLTIHKSEERGCTPG